MGVRSRKNEPARGKPLAASQPPVPPSGRNRSATFLVLVLAALAVLGLFFLATGGCVDEIDAVYGQRAGSAWTSVNGTSVLGKMFERAGHTVFSWRMLSPRLRRRADCIVWFPDDFHPPKEQACQWLEGWLREEPGRTLVYVGRDFDAAAWYWETIQPNAPAEQKQEILRRIYSPAVRRRSATGFRPRAAKSIGRCVRFRGSPSGSRESTRPSSGSS